MKLHNVKRRNEAKLRQEKRDALTNSEQLKRIHKRPGDSIREATKLRRRIEKNTAKNPEKELE